MAEAVILMGSNFKKQSNILDAVSELESRFLVKKYSKIYEKIGRAHV